MSFFHISPLVFVKKQLFDLFTFSVVLIALLAPSSFTFGNSPPSDINATNLTIAENSAIGTVIGEFNATDPDGDSNITYSLSNGISVLGWTSSRLLGDDNSGISSDLNYTCAVNVNGASKIVNGVTFVGSSATSGDGWAIISGFNNRHASETSSVLEI